MDDWNKGNKWLVYLINHELYITECQKLGEETSINEQIATSPFSSLSLSN